MRRSGKLLDKIIQLFGNRRKNSFTPSWESGASGFGERKSARLTVLSGVKKLLTRAVPRTRTRTFVSRSENRKKFLLQVVKGVTTVSLIIGALLLLKKPAMHFASSIDFFKIQEITVQGYERTSVAEIKKIANFDYNSSLIALSPGGAEQKLLKHPWIRYARVKRIWPDGLYVRVKEHRATALLITAGPDGEMMVYTNAKGKIIAPVKIGEELDYPVITGLGGLADGEMEVAVAEAARFLKLAARNNPNLPAQSVSEIHFDPVEGMVIRLVDFPFPIYYGRDNVEKKYDQLRRVLAVLYRKQKNSINIGQVEYIRMNYLNNKVLVAQAKSG